MWFSNWSELLRIVLVGAAAYLTLVIVLRTSGKRTLAKLNAFDLAVTVALGSTLATIFLDKSVSWAEGAVALGMLALLQFVVAEITTRTGGRSIVTATPTLLVQDGHLLEDRLRQQRMTAAEVRQAVRSSGVGDLALVAAAVLESDGTVSVVARQQAGDLSALQDVEGGADG
jgi:uncharacterized membrane protein YcaP (DUF421 family)